MCPENEGQNPRAGWQPTPQLLPGRGRRHHCISSSGGSGWCRAEQGPAMDLPPRSAPARGAGSPSPHSHQHPQNHATSISVPATSSPLQEHAALHFARLPVLGPSCSYTPLGMWWPGGAGG